jgi:uncharacterized protein YfcZ (UPF0381/DUF406 family)
MKKDDIVRMAGEAGFVIDENAQQHQPNCVFHTYHMVDELLERFAALVAAAEREACAKLVEDKFDFCGDELTAATAIRARGQA